MDEHRGIRESKYPMTPVPKCVSMVLSNTRSADRFCHLRLDMAANRVVAEDIHAPWNMPQRPTSIMDGYAVNSNDPTFFKDKNENDETNTYDKNGVKFEVTQLLTAGIDGQKSKSKSKSNDEFSYGQAAYITTGSVLPIGTDAVIKIEDTTLVENESNFVKFHTFPKKSGTFVRQPGSDMKKGELIICKGTVLHASEIGLLAMCGVTNVAVYSRPRVTVLSTGDELIDPLSIHSNNDENKNRTENKNNSKNDSTNDDVNVQTEKTGKTIEGNEKGLIYDSNRPLLMQLLKEFGFEVTVIDGKIMRDNREKLEKYILQLLLKCDVLITTGGVSMGSRDYIKPILENLAKKCNDLEMKTKENKENTENENKNEGCSKVHFGRMLMKPGKPTTFASLKLNPKLYDDGVYDPNDSSNDIEHTKLAFGLPGNPVSCNVTFKLLVDPCVKKLAGLPQHKWQLAPVNVELAQGISMDPVRPEYHRSTIYWDKFKMRYIAYSTGFQRSSRLLSMLNANCLLRIPQKSGNLESGTMVKALIIDDMIPDMPPQIDEKTGSMIIRHGCKCEDGHHHGHHHHGHHHHHHHHHEHHHKQDPVGGTTQHHVHGGPGCKHGHKHNGHATTNPVSINAAILTVSDRASKGVYEDLSGPALGSVLTKNFGENNGYNVKYECKTTRVVEDDKEKIQNTLLEWCKQGNINLILTTGGTGFGNRDVTPEATKAILEKETPGIVHVMMSESLKKTPFAALSRYTAGINGNTLIINMPGSVKAVTECLEAIIGILPHALAELERNRNGNANDDSK